MSLNGSKKEELFKLILYHHPHYIEELLNTKLDNLEYESYEERRYYDLLGIEEKSNLKIIIEVQLNKSDHTHFERIQSFYDDPIDNAKIVWIAKDFHKKMVETIIHELNYEYTKNIDFYAVTFDEAILPLIENLNLTTEEEKYDKIINFKRPLKLEVFDKTRLIPEGLTVKIEPQITNPKLIKNRHLVESLRNSTPWNLNLYRSKSRLNESTLLFGAGKSYIHYQISICRRDINYSFVRLVLTEAHGKETFNIIKQKIRLSNEFKGFNLIEDSNQIKIRLNKEVDYKEDASKVAMVFSLLHSIVAKIVYDTYLII